MLYICPGSPGRHNSTDRCSWRAPFGGKVLRKCSTLYHNCRWSPDYLYAQPSGGVKHKASPARVYEKWMGLGDGLIRMSAQYVVVGPPWGGGLSALSAISTSQWYLSRNASAICFTEAKARSTVRSLSGLTRQQVAGESMLPAII